MAGKKKSIAEFGDFQTPPVLALRVCRALAARGVNPAAIVEPNCGVGAFVEAGRTVFPNAQVLAADINPQHLAALRSRLPESDRESLRIEHADFFEFDWNAAIEALPDPVLALGNPPWVTNSELGALGSTNLPSKANGGGLTGMDALTGKSNFDISEAMFLRLLRMLSPRHSCVAMLCKTAVARKVLTFAWNNALPLRRAEIVEIDAAKEFGVSVAACLLLCEFGAGMPVRECGLFENLDSVRPRTALGFRDGQLIADLEAFDRRRHLAGGGADRWRSGVKHDCAAVMELLHDDGAVRNGRGETVDIESDYLFPMLKGSAIAGGRARAGQRSMIVPQRFVGEETGGIQSRAPRTWNYLTEHGRDLDRRASRIYREKPRFSIFGIGPYAFAPWKVAISALYKKLNFVVVGNVAGKPIVLDDTSYFLPCQSEDEAELLAELLNSDVAKEFFSAYIFWDAKRPITAELLGKLNLESLASVMGRLEDYRRLRSENSRTGERQGRLFIK